MKLFATITKTEDTADGLIVEGIATTERTDSAGEIVDYDFVKACLPDYEQWGNIREMHGPSAAGRALVVTADDASRTIFVKALIIDDQAIKKVKAKVYKGFSIGGGGERKIVKNAAGDGTHTRVYMKLLSEISLADRPANPDAKITLFKAEGMTMADDKEQEVEQPDALAKVKALAAKTTTVKKAAGDPSKIVSQIQAARNQAELDGDMDGAQLYTQAIALIMQASGDAEAPEDSDQDVTTTTDTPTDEVTMAARVADVKKSYPGLSDAAATEFVKAGYIATGVAKAGRAISGGRMSALKAAAKALLQMSADAGDEESGVALKAFGAALADASASAPADSGAVEMMAKITDNLNAVATVVLKVSGDLEAIKKQPAGGGPALRRVDKALGTQNGGGEDDKPDALVELRKAQDATTDPIAKHQIGEQIAVIEFRRNRFGG